MKIDNLVEGATYKNYRDVCRVLEIDSGRTGRSRELHIIELARYFEHVKVPNSNKWIITKIYDEPLEKIDKRGGNNNIYGDRFDKLIINYLSRQMKNGFADQLAYDDKWMVSITTKGLIRKLKIINDKFDDKTHMKQAVAKKLGMESVLVNEFFYNTSKMLNSAVISALGRLEKSGLVEKFENVRMINIKEFDRASNKVITHSREADLSECSLIRIGEEEALKEIKCSSVQDVLLKGKADEYFKSVYIIIQKKLPSLKYYYSSLKIFFSSTHVKEASSFVDELTLEDIRMELNNVLCTRISRNALNRHERARKPDAVENYSNAIKIDDSYCENYIALVNEVFAYSRSEESCHFQIS